MGNRNFGTGSRDINVAGIFILQNTMESYSTIRTRRNHWRRFCKFLRQQNIRYMEDITKDILEAYGHSLLTLVQESQMKKSTAQNYLSSVNVILQYARGDKTVWVSPTTDCQIPKRSGIATVSQALSDAQFQELIDNVDPRLASILMLQRFFGLRIEESLKLNAHLALKGAKKNNAVDIINGTKGGKTRTIPITSEDQLTALQIACRIQGKDRSMIPKDLSYIQFARQCYRALRKTVIPVHFHQLRHTYAQERYIALSCVLCPVAAGIQHGKKHIEYISDQLQLPIEDARKLDETARITIAEELGHHRTRITHEYLG